MRFAARAVPTVGLALMFAAGAASAAGADPKHPTPAPVVSSPSSAPHDGHGATPATDGTNPPAESSTKPTPDQSTKPTPVQGTKPTPDPGSQPPEQKATKPADDHGTKPGDDHGTKSGDDHGTTPGGDQDPMPGMDMPASEHNEPVNRPRNLVIGGFAAVNGAVLLAAAGVRRRGQAVK